MQREKKEREDKTWESLSSNSSTGALHTVYLPKSPPVLWQAQEPDKFERFYLLEFIPYRIMSYETGAPSTKFTDSLCAYLVNIYGIPNLKLNFIC